jgi:hypothetical protein
VFTFYNAQKFDGDENFTFGYLLLVQYRSIFSGYKFSQDEADIFTIFMYVMLTVIQVLIMVNLLISIVGDTNRHTKQNRAMKEPESQNNIVIELESYMIWNRRKNDRYNLIFAAYEKVLDASAWRANIVENTIALDHRLEALEKNLMQKIDSQTMLAPDASNASRVVQSDKQGSPNEMTNQNKHFSKVNDSLVNVETNQRTMISKIDS